MTCSSLAVSPAASLRLCGKFLSFLPYWPGERSHCGRGHKKPGGIAVPVLIAVTLLFASANPVLSEEGPYKQYTDPRRRFIFDYPASMQVRAPSPDEVHLVHPQASFRVSVHVEKMQAKKGLAAEELLVISRKRMEEEMKEITLLGHGKLPGLDGSQAFMMVAFRDKKGLRLVQLVQYYAAKDRFLQMTISDRPEGFKNLESVIRRVHRSLKIVNPALD